MLETFAQEVERLLEDFAKGANEAVDALFEWSDEMVDQLVEQLDEAIAPELTEFERQMGTWIEPFVQVVVGFENTVADSVQPFTQTVEPMMNQHSACVGCRNYHGQTYGGNMLVCGMHPSGWESEQCPDWESTWGKEE